MDKKIKREWVAALRSGEYEQGSGGSWVSDGAYCCLAVLHDVTGGKFVMHHSDGVLVPVREDGAITGWLVGLLPARFQRELADMNDSGKTFAEIADWIEANL